LWSKTRPFWDLDFISFATVQDWSTFERASAVPCFANPGGDQDFLEAIRSDPVRYGFSFDVDALPAPFPAPTLIVAGRQDFVVGYRDAWQVIENYPRGTFAVLDRASHILEFEQEGLFRSLASEWLDRVEEYSKHR
jgi:pimeloyl-ACP methyl ester carboxylesterase